MNVSTIISLLLHADVAVKGMITQYGSWVYGILFLIIFIETGVVVMPFLPGDSLLFVAGTLAGSGLLNVGFLFAVMCLAAIIGDSVNYWIGNYLGKGILDKGKVPFINQEHLQRTQRFYEKHGGKTIILARFMPFVRTFAPFVAGVARMNYFYFLMYNVIGGVAWTGLFILAGFFFGNIPTIQHNLTTVIIGIIILSLLPGIISYVRKKIRKS